MTDRGNQQIRAPVIHITHKIAELVSYRTNIIPLRPYPTHTHTSHFLLLNGLMSINENHTETHINFIQNA